jgi:hypothetical protein
VAHGIHDQRPQRFRWEGDRFRLLTSALRRWAMTIAPV